MWSEGLALGSKMKKKKQENKLQTDRDSQAKLVLFLVAIEPCAECLKLATTLDSLIS